MTFQLKQQAPWSKRALCLLRGGDLDLFYPDKGEPTEPAKAICRACPVRAECLQLALATKEAFGIWGGLTTEARRRLPATPTAAPAAAATATRPAARPAAAPQAA